VRSAERSVNAPTIGAAPFTDEFLLSLRERADDPADQAVSQFFASLDAPNSSLFPMLMRTSHTEVDDEDAPGVGAFARAEEPWPDWVDPDLVRDGQKVFGDWGMQLASGLFMASLPLTYACAKGAEPLIRTQRFHDNPRRRILETGQMIIEAMTPGALEPGKRGYRAVRHVRLMHAAVRHTLLHVHDLPTASGTVHLAPWDPALGVPLNQEDLLGGLFAFNVLGLRCLGQIGIKLTQREQEAYVHAWNLVGHQLGVAPELLPLNAADSLEIADRILAQQSAPSDAGHQLTQHAIEGMQQLLKVRPLRGLPVSGIHYFLGNDVATTLGVGRSNWTIRLFAVMKGVDGVASKALSWLPGQHSISASIGRRVVTGIEDSERGPGRPQFEISDELRAAWGIGPKKQRRL
jgi:hypothetical protein